VSAAHERFTVFGFAGTHDALQAEDALLSAGAEVALIPTPRSLGTLCGFAVRVPASERERALEIMSAAGIVPDGDVEMLDRVSAAD